MLRISDEPITFSALERIAAQHYNAFMDTMEFIRLTYSCEDSERWEFCDETKSVRRVKVPTMEWLPFEEKNDELP